MKMCTEMILNTEEMQQLVLSYLKMMGELDRGLSEDDEPSFTPTELLQIVEDLFSGNTEFAKVTQNGDQFTFVQEVDGIDPKYMFASMTSCAYSMGKMIAEEEERG